MNGSDAMRKYWLTITSLSARTWVTLGFSLVLIASFGSLTVLSTHWVRIGAVASLVVVLALVGFVVAREVFISPSNDRNWLSSV